MDRNRVYLETAGSRGGTPWVGNMGLGPTGRAPAVTGTAASALVSGCKAMGKRLLAYHPVK